MARSLTDPLERIPALHPLRPAGAPGSVRRPRVIGRPLTEEEQASEAPPEEKEGSETYDAEGHLHHVQVHQVDIED